MVAWIDNDPNCFCVDIGALVGKSFDPPGLTAFESIAQHRFNTTPADLHHRRNTWSGFLRAIYQSVGDPEIYESFALQTGLTAADCLVLAQAFQLPDPELALNWVRRGMELNDKFSSNFQYTSLERNLLAALGRHEESLNLAWAGYLNHPSVSAYDQVMELVPDSDRAGAHNRAMDAAAVANLDTQFSLYLEKHEIDRLASSIAAATDESLESLSHRFTQPAAEALDPDRPALAARLWRAQGLRIVNAAKSKYYEAAVSNFDRAMRSYARANLVPQWESLVSQIRLAHRRKTLFMRGFELVAAGAGYRPPPSFLERAKARWGTEPTLVQRSESQ